MKFKFPYNINDVKRMAKHALGMAAVFAVPFIACHKQPLPEPEPTPTPTPGPDTTIVEPPVDTVTYPDTIWLKFQKPIRAPNMDSVVFYASKNSVKKIIMKLEPYNSTGYTPSAFHAARDSLSKRIDVNPQKVRGAGTIYVANGTGASLPDPTATNIAGMTPDDSVFFTTNGWVLQRGYPLDKQR